MFSSFPPLFRTSILEWASKQINNTNIDIVDCCLYYADNIHKFTKKNINEYQDALELYQEVEKAKNTAVPIFQSGKHKIYKINSNNDAEILFRNTNWNPDICSLLFIENYKLFVEETNRGNKKLYITKETTLYGYYDQKDIFSYGQKHLEDFPNLQLEYGKRKIEQIIIDDYYNDNNQYREDFSSLLMLEIHKCKFKPLRRLLFERILPKTYYINFINDEDPYIRVICAKTLSLKDLLLMVNDKNDDVIIEIVKRINCDHLHLFTNHNNEIVRYFVAKRTTKEQNIEKLMFDPCDMIRYEIVNKINIDKLIYFCKDPHPGIRSIVAQKINKDLLPNMINDSDHYVLAHVIARIDKRFYKDILLHATGIALTELLKRIDYKYLKQIDESYLNDNQALILKHRLSIKNRLKEVFV